MPNLEKMNAAKAKLIEEEKKKLQIQQKALDVNAQMTLSEIKALQKENTKRIIDRILFVLGLIMATVLMCVLIWPAFSTSMNFFNFKNPQAAYDQGTITEVEKIYWKPEIEGVIKSVLYYHDPNCTCNDKVKDCDDPTHIIPIQLDQTKGECFMAYEGHGSYGPIMKGYKLDVKNHNIILVSCHDFEKDKDGNLITNIQEYWFELDLQAYELSTASGQVSIHSVDITPKQGTYARTWESSLVDQIPQLKENVEKYQENHELTRVSYEFKAARGVFFVGFNPDDAMLCTLYCICGILFFVMLIALVVGYIILMSYGIRYFVGLIRGIAQGAKTIVVDAGKNVAGAVLEETADKTLEDSMKETERKRKAAAEKRKATMAKKKAAAEKGETSEALPVSTVHDEDSGYVNPESTEDTESKTESEKPEETVDLDNLTDEQLDALLNGAAPASDNPNSLFSDNK